MRARQRPHRLDLLLGHPGGDEAGEVALAVGHAERRVARARQLARGVDDALEHGVDRPLAGDRQDGVAHRPHRAASALAHRAPRYGAPGRAASGAGPRTSGRRQPSAGFGQGSPRRRISRPASASSTTPPAIQGSGDEPPSWLGLLGREHDLVHARLGAPTPSSVAARKGASPRVARRYSSLPTRRRGHPHVALGGVAAAHQPGAGHDRRRERVASARRRCRSSSAPSTRAAPRSGGSVGGPPSVAPSAGRGP